MQYEHLSLYYNILMVNLEYEPKTTSLYTHSSNKFIIDQDFKTNKILSKHQGPPCKTLSYLNPASLGR